jgi:hypothetical protein
MDPLHVKQLLVMLMGMFSSTPFTPMFVPWLKLKRLAEEEEN